MMVAALHVVSGRTTMFTERAPSCHIKPNARRAQGDLVRPRITRRPRAGFVRRFRCSSRLGASASTTIATAACASIRRSAPAIRAGAERLVIVSVRHERSQREVAAVEAADAGSGGELSSAFLIGKLLNALLLDPVAYDLQVLERLNQVMEVLEETLDADDLERIQKGVDQASRGAPYRRLKARLPALLEIWAGLRASSSRSRSRPPTCAPSPST